MNSLCANIEIMEHFEPLRLGESLFSLMDSMNAEIANMMGLPDAPMTKPMLSSAAFAEMQWNAAVFEREIFHKPLLQGVIDVNMSLMKLMYNYEHIHGCLTEFYNFLGQIGYLKWEE